MRVLITGASRGIGKEFVRHYLKKGCEVHAVTRNSERLNEMKTEKLTLHSIDLESPEGAKNLANVLNGKKIDLLINNAGILLDRGSKLLELSEEIVRKSFEVNTLIPFRVCQALLPNLKGGKVAQITSLMGSIADNGRGGYYGYRMSKVALNMFNRSFSIDHPEILTVALHPGWVKTEMGGEGATTSTEESVAGMTKIIDSLTPEKSGNFYDYEGDELPW